jgi:tyrosyl-tRNA synthetase
MSASDPDSKIDLLDPPEVVKRKIKKAVAVPKIVEDNGLLAFVEFVLFPAARLRTTDTAIVVDRTRDNLPPLEYTDIIKMREDYAADILSPQLLKPAVADALNKLLAPIQEAFQASKEFQEIALKAYPPPEVQKKAKKVKKVGTGYPGAKGVASTEAGGAASAKAQEADAATTTATTTESAKEEVAKGETKDLPIGSGPA